MSKTSEPKKDICLKKKMRQALGLYLYFFKIGWFTFGGGWSIVAQMQTDYVEKKQAIESQELLDIVSVGKSLPGTMIGNVAYLFGYHMGGVPGGVMAVLGIITPPLIILSVATFFYNNVRDNAIVAKGLAGVRAVVAPVILSAVLKLNKGAFPTAACYILCAAGCILSLFFRVNSVLIVVIGIIAGLILSRKTEATA